MEEDRCPQGIIDSIGAQVGQRAFFQRKAAFVKDRLHIKPMRMKNIWYIRPFDKGIEQVILVGLLLFIAPFEHVIDAVGKSGMGDIVNETSDLLFQRSSILAQQEIDAKRVGKTSVVLLADIIDLLRPKRSISSLVDETQPLKRWRLYQIEYNRFMNGAVAIDSIVIVHETSKRKQSG